MDPRTVIVVASDLMTRQRVVSQLDAAGYRTAALSSAEDLEAHLDDERLAALVVEFDDTRVDPIAIIERIRGDEMRRSLPILAFGAHTRTHAMDAARRAGASAVVARGQMMRRAAAVIQETLSGIGDSEIP